MKRKDHVLGELIKKSSCLDKLRYVSIFLLGLVVVVQETNGAIQNHVEVDRVHGKDIDEVQSREQKDLAQESMTGVTVIMTEKDHHIIINRVEMGTPDDVADPNSFVYNV